MVVLARRAVDLQPAELPASSSRGRCGSRRSPRWPNCSPMRRMISPASAVDSHRALAFGLDDDRFRRHAVAHQVGAAHAAFGEHRVAARAAGGQDARRQLAADTVPARGPGARAAPATAGRGIPPRPAPGSRRRAALHRAWTAARCAPRRTRCRPARRAPAADATAIHTARFICGILNVRNTIVIGCRRAGDDFERRQSAAEGRAARHRARRPDRRGLVRGRDLPPAGRSAAQRLRGESACWPRNRCARRPKRTCAGWPASEWWCCRTRCSRASPAPKPARA